MSEAIKISADNRERIFDAAYNGSYYTILGCAGDLNEWTAGYRELLGEWKSHVRLTPCGKCD